MADSQFDLGLFSYQETIRQQEAATKLCWVCQQAKPFDSFGKDASRGDGFNPKCRACCADIHAKRVEANPRTEKRCVLCEVVKPITDYDVGEGEKRTLFRKRCRECFAMHGTGTPSHQRKPFARSPNAAENSRKYRKRLTARVDVPLPAEKKCIECEHTKPASAFSLCKSEKDGIKRVCKLCAAAIRLENMSRPRRKVAQKTCSRCNQTENIDKFSMRADSPDGYAPHCKVCDVGLVLKWYSVPANRMRTIRRTSQWVADNPDHARALRKVSKARRRSREILSGEMFTSKEWLDLLNYYGRRCAYCLRHESEVGDMTHDHLRPLSRGGSNGIDNAVPACFRCNISKHANTLLDLLHRDWLPPVCREACEST